LWDNKGADFHKTKSYFMYSGCVPGAQFHGPTLDEGEGNDNGWLLVNPELSLVRLSQGDIHHHKVDEQWDMLSSHTIWPHMEGEMQGSI
jgi:hypothetical protein